LLLSGTPFSLNNVKIKDSPDFRVVNMFFSPFSTPEEKLIGGLLLVDDNTKNYEIQQRLVEAEKFSLIGSLTSMITHEVNNPLDGVMRLINISLAHIGADDPVRTYLTEAQKGLQRIASLVSSLLSFSRKSVSLDGEFTHLNAIIDSVVSAVRVRNDDKRVSVNLKLAPENPRVKTNDFYQVISNLVSNSFDAIALAGNVTIQALADDTTLHIIVEDDGCGIPKRMQSRIFSAFWTTKEYGKGTGLGLAIVKKVVDKYEGAIHVQSEEKAGTKMHLKFPLEKITCK
jgi:signal transduction histidine kinase